MRLGWWLATVIGVSLFTIVLSEQQALDPVHNMSLTVMAPMSSGLRDAARPVDDVLKGITDRGDLVRENRELREQNEQLQNDLAARQDAEQRVRDLETALGVKQGRPEEQLLAANVIAEDTSGLKQLIAIDRGLSDGVDEGMVVISGAGSLVGTVSRAYDEFAWVRLITDPESAVNAQVIPGEPSPSPAAPTSTPAPPEPTPGPSTPAGAPTASPAAPTPTPPPPEPVRGVAEGDLRRGVVLDLLPPDTVLAQGSLVTTSGLGGNYPRALLIGSVEGLEQRPQSPFTKATLEPAADLSTLDTVLVLISFQPARLTEQ